MKALIAALAISFTVLGCGIGDKAEQFRQMAEAAEEKLEAGDSAGAFRALMGGGEQVQPVDFRTLKELLPETLDGLYRESATGERRTMSGVGISEAQGEYESQDTDARMHISITDFGGVRSIAMMGFGWTMVDVDNESDRGYERTLEYEGYPAYVKYERSDDWSRGEMAVVVVDRFVVNVEGSNVRDDAIREALKSVDIDELEDLKDAGVGEAPPETPDLAEFAPHEIPEVQEESGEGTPETMADMITRQNEAGHIDPIDFRELKDMLPAELSGMPQVDSEGEKGGAMGIIHSSARATYQPEGDRRTSITVMIKDTGNLRGAMAMAGYSWLMVETEKESSTGFERTTTYSGYPAFESYSTMGKRPWGKIEVVIANRFAVEVEARNVEWDVIEDVIDRIDLTGLAARADEHEAPAG